MLVTKEITTQRVELRVQLRDPKTPKFQGIAGADFYYYPDDEYVLLMPVGYLSSFFHCKDVFILTNFEVFDLEYGIDWIFAKRTDTDKSLNVTAFTRDGLLKYLSLMPQSRIVKAFRNIVKRKTQGGRHEN
jgi:hypothetical protein